MFESFGGWLLYQQWQPMLKKWKVSCQLGSRLYYKANGQWKKGLKGKKIVQFVTNFHLLKGSIHNWVTKKECLTEKGLQMTTLDFCLSYIIIIVVDCCMPINKMKSS